jgi:hypothetical protein
LRTGHRQGLFELGVLNAEWIAGAFQSAQSFDEANGATTLSHKHWPPSPVGRLAQDGVSGLDDALLNEHIERWFGVFRQRSRVAKLSPQDLQRRM